MSKSNVDYTFSNGKNIVIFTVNVKGKIVKS